MATVPENSYGVLDGQIGLQDGLLECLTGHPEKEAERTLSDQCGNRVDREISCRNSLFIIVLQLQQTPLTSLDGPGHAKQARTS